MTFAQPSAPGGGDQFNAADHRGHLLLIYPKSYQPEVQTKNGPSSAADVDIVIVDKVGPDGQPLHFMNARLFGNLANSVRNDLGGQVLGRLDQINTQGGRTPWILQNFTDADAAAAGPVHAAYQQGQFRPTPNPMAAAAPTQQQWSGGAAAGYSPATTPPAPAPAATWQAPTQAAATAPPQQWQQQQAPPPQAQQWAQPPAPAPATAPTPAPTTPAPAAGVDPQLAAFLQQRGLNTDSMTQEQAVAIAAAYQ